MRIARFTTGEDPQYGVVTGDVDELGIPADDAMVVALAGDPLYVGVQLTEQQFPLKEVRLLAPVLPRSKVVGIGRNYAAHAAEMGNDVPDEPMMFIKPNTAVIGPGDPIFYPRQSREVHFEGELCVVIGRICRDRRAARCSVRPYLPGRRSAACWRRPDGAATGRHRADRRLGRRCPQPGSPRGVRPGADAS